MFFARFGDVKIDAAGLSGLNSGLIDGISLSITDATEASETLKAEVFADNAAAQEASRDVRGNPQGVLSGVEALLDSVIGADKVSLAGISANQTIEIALEFSFLKDYQEEILFNIDLASLQGDALKD